LRELSACPDSPREAVKAAAFAAFMASRSWQSQGLLDAAEDGYRDALAAQKLVLGPDNLATLETWGGLADVTYARGHHAAAEAEYRDILAAKLRVLGPDHPSTLASRHNLAVEIGGRGDRAAAEAELRDVLAGWLRVQGPDDPGTLITRNQLARLIV